jgi:hypothetical protein
MGIYMYICMCVHVKVQEGECLGPLIRFDADGVGWMDGWMDGWRASALAGQASDSREATDSEREG